MTGYSSVVYEAILISVIKEKIRGKSKGKSCNYNKKKLQYNEKIH